MRLRHICATATIALLGLTAWISPAQAATSGLDGTVVDDTGAAVSTCVEAYDTTWNYVDSTCTDPVTGAWSLPNLADGSYQVYIQGGATTIGEWYDNARRQDLATVVTTPATLATTLTTGVPVTGILTTDTGGPAAGFSVELLDTFGTAVAWAYTDDAGAWSTIAPPGDVKVEFTSWPVDQWAYGKSTFDAADTISIVAGSPMQIDNQLLPVRHIRGTITGTGGQPISGACAHYGTVVAGEWNDLGTSCTGSDGTYDLIPWGAADGPATVWFDDENELATYAAEYAGNTYDASKAALVDVTTSPTVDAQLAVGGVITGKVLTERRPTPLANVCPQAYAGRSGGSIRGIGVQCSDASGTYRVTALPPGPVALYLAPDYHSGQAPEWYLDQNSQATATLVPASLGRTTTVRPNKFVPGGMLSGLVTDRAGKPVPDAWVYLQGDYPGRAGPGEGQFVAQTDAAGRYAINAPAGTYTPLVVPPGSSGLAPQWSGGAVTKATGTSVTLRIGKTSKVNAVVVPASRVAGSVRTTSGATPDANDYVVGFIYTQTGDYIGDFDAYSDGGFDFVSSSLSRGSFLLKVEVVDRVTDESRGTFWFDASTTEAGATLVPVAAGDTSTVTFHLP